MFMLRVNAWFNSALIIWLCSTQGAVFCRNICNCIKNILYHNLEWQLLSITITTWVYFHHSWWMKRAYTNVHSYDAFIGLSYSEWCIIENDYSHILVFKHNKRRQCDRSLYGLIFLWIGNHIKTKQSHVIICRYHEHNGELPSSL